MKRIIVALLAIAMTATVALAQTEEIKAGFIYVGPIGDAGWSYAHNEGRMAMEKLPFVTDTTYIESVPEGADAARVIRSLAQKGYNMIFTTSFGFMDATIDVAKKFPDTVFLHCSGYKTADNAGNYFGRMYQPRYLSGLIAGSMTESDTIGYVAAFPIPEVIRGINAFTLGVREVNPNATVRVVWTSTWFDPGKEREAAESLLDVGADVLAMHQDTPATPQAAESRGAYVIGYNTDMSQFAPKAFLTAPIWNWAPYYTEMANQVHDGTWEADSDWWGMEKGIVKLAPISPKVPATVRDMVAKKKQAIVDGTFNVFAGPIKDQSGAVVVKEGTSLADGELLGMNFFVEGVQGSLGN